MNLFLNKKSIFTVAILIVVGAISFMLLPQSSLKGLLFGYYDNSEHNLPIFSSENPNIVLNYSFVNVSNIPSFKKGKNIQSNELSTKEIDFKAASYSTSEVTNKNATVVKNTVENIPISNSSYNYRQPQTASNYIANIHTFSSAKVTFQTSNTVNKVSNNLQSEGVYGTTNSSTSNTNSNSFLANNTLSITTDLSENNSPMLIDGESNPGEVGVPIGDGVWIMIFFLGVYCLKKSFLV